MNIATYCRTLQYNRNEIIRQILSCESFLKINMINVEPDIFIDIRFCGICKDRPMYLKMIKKAVDLDLDMILVDRWNVLSENLFVIHDIYNHVKKINKDFKIYSISEGELENKILRDLI